MNGKGEMENSLSLSLVDYCLTKVKYMLALGTNLICVI